MFLVWETIIGLMAFSLGWALGKWALLFAPLPACWALATYDSCWANLSFRQDVIRELGSGYLAIILLSGCLPAAGLLTGVLVHSLLRRANREAVPASDGLSRARR